MSDTYESRVARLEAAINLQEPDRVPVVPFMEGFAGRHAGLTMQEYLFDPVKAAWAMEKTFDDYGGWDAMAVPDGLMSADSLSFVFTSRILWPGIDLPEDSVHQILEQEAMKADEYDAVLTEGWNAFSTRYMRRVNPRIPETPEAYFGKLFEIVEIMNQGIRHWKERGVPTVIGAMGSSAGAGLFSSMRSLSQWALDLYRQPEKVKAATEVVAKAKMALDFRKVEATGLRRIFLGGARDSASFISPKMYEEFAFPYLKWQVETLADHDIISVLHYDTDWTENLPYFKELPRGRCILMLDGATDIFKAKEILRDHMCIWGDVPPTLLLLGTPQEVSNYVKRLIDVVGDGGGFILGSGCEVPVDARPENVQAMIDAGKTYGAYH